MKPQTVFFDMGGTIDVHRYDREPGIRVTAQIRELLARADVEVSLNDDQLYDLITGGQKAYREWREESYVELSPKRVWREFVLKDFHLQSGQIDPVAEDLSYIVDTRYYQRKMRPEIPAVLEELKALGFRMGIISNVQSRRQVPDDLERYGIKDFFYPIVLSCEHGRRKPDPAIFHYAAQMAGVPSSSCVHIGDRISRDILGARQAGFAVALQIKHAFEEDRDPEEPRPDAVLESMKELPEILATCLKDTADS